MTDRRTRNAICVVCSLPFVVSGHDRKTCGDDCSCRLRRQRWREHSHTDKAKARKEKYKKEGRAREWATAHYEKNIDLCRKQKRISSKRYKEKNRGKVVAYQAQWREKNKCKIKADTKARSDKVLNLIAVLRKEMPDLLKEFGL